MSEPTTEQDNEQPESAAEAKPAQAAAGFSLLRVSCVVLPVFLLAVGCVLFFGLFDGAGWIADLMKPPLVHSTGHVLMNGQPLSKGEVRTQHMTPGVAGAIGFMNEQGEFVLKTEIKGDFIDGAYEGEHKVMVTKYGMARGPSAPLLVPEKYASFKTTPLKIVVSRDTENRFPLTMEGEPADSGMSEEEFAAQQEKQGPDALTLTSQLFEKLDANQDGSLNAEELQVLTGDALEQVQAADQDNDGEVFHQELYGVVGRSPALFEPLVAEDDQEN